MREILFRGKDRKGEWVYGWLGHPHCYNPQTKEIDSVYFTELREDLSGRLNVIVDYKTIGQCTGLTDKNGTKIFEGDYWLDTDGDYIVFVVEFRDGQFCFVSYGVRGVLMPYGYDEDAGDFGELDCEPMTDFIIENIEIDGNIHDNPDVLER